MIQEKTGQIFRLVMDTPCRAPAMFRPFAFTHNVPSRPPWVSRARVRPAPSARRQAVYQRIVAVSTVVLDAPQSIASDAAPVWNANGITRGPTQGLHHFIALEWGASIG